MCTDQLKTDSEKDEDPLGNVVEKNRLHKAKRTLEDVQKLNNLEKVFSEKKSRTPTSWTILSL
jgi:hypothetical protein